MAGRRSTGRALAGAATLATQLLLKRQEEARARRERWDDLRLKFATELAADRAKAGLEFTNPFTGERTPAMAGMAGMTPSIPAGLEPSGISYKDPLGVTRSFGRPLRSASDAVRPLTGQAEQAVIGLEEPGRPFSGQVPISPQALATLQGGVSAGRFESPAAAFRTAPPGGGPVATPDAFPLTFDGSAEASAPRVDPRVLLSAFSRGLMQGALPGAIRPILPALPFWLPTPSPSTRRSARPMLPALPVPAAPSGVSDESSLLADAVAARSEGFTDEEVREQLLNLGVDPETVKRLLADAGF